jgi:hypothetical protein
MTIWVLVVGATSQNITPHAEAFARLRSLRSSFLCQDPKFGTDTTRKIFFVTLFSINSWPGQNGKYNRYFPSMQQICSCPSGEHHHHNINVHAQFQTAELGTYLLQSPGSPKSGMSCDVWMNTHDAADTFRQTATPCALLSGTPNHPVTGKATSASASLHQRQRWWSRTCRRELVLVGSLGINIWSTLDSKTWHSGFLGSCLRYHVLPWTQSNKISVSCS